MYTNKALLAVYEEIPAENEATVTFYKPNKEVVASTVVDKGANFGETKPATTPSIVGFTNFIGWYLEEGKVAGLQEAIIARMERNGYVTDQMRNDVYNQTHIPSLINWVKSF